MPILGPNLVSITYDSGEVHSLSVAILELLAESAPNAGTGAVAAGLTLGRLMSPDRLDELDEEEFLTSLLTWISAYFNEGEAN